MLYPKGVGVSLVKVSERVGKSPRGTWVNFCWVCAAGLLEPLPHYSLLCDQLYLIIYPILVTLGQIRNFRDPNLVTFSFY